MTQFYQTITVILVLVALNSVLCLDVPASFKNNPLDYPQLDLLVNPGIHFNIRTYAIVKTSVADEFLISDEFSIWRVNMATKPPTKTHIAGSNEAGYREDSGYNVRFNRPVDIAFIDANEVLVSDHNNSCIRKLDIQTGSTSRYAGLCESPYYVEGHRLNSARMKMPMGLLKDGNQFYFSDMKNSAIRVIQHDRVSTFFRGSPIHYPAYMVDVGNYFYVTVQHAVARIHKQFKSAEVISGDVGQLRSFGNGPLRTSRFAMPLGIRAINDNSLLVVDHDNNRLRHLNLAKNQVTSICTGVRGYTTQAGRADCRLNLPWCASIDYKDIIYIGEYGGQIRELTAYENPVFG